MFGDLGFSKKREAVQVESYHKWLKTVDKNSAKLVVIGKKHQMVYNLISILSQKLVPEKPFQPCKWTVIGCKSNISVFG